MRIGAKPNLIRALDDYRSYIDYLASNGLILVTL
jgi:hypothetical protein